MQLMEITYSLGTIAEIIFFAYVLKVVKLSKSQNLMAYVQASYLVSHTFAGLLADYLLKYTSAQISDLLWISAIGLILATIISILFRQIDDEEQEKLANYKEILVSVYKENNFLLLSL